MGAKLGGRGGGPIADINVTPLIDVVLVLLVVFMVITPMLSSGLPVDLPMATSTITVNDAGQHVVVSITKNGEWAIDQEVLEGEDREPGVLVTKVREVKFAAAARGEDKFVLVKADRSLPYRDVREVLDALGEANFPQVLIAAGKEK